MTGLIPFALIVLVTIIVAGRSYFAVERLRATAASLRERADRMDGPTYEFLDAVARFRRELAGVNAAAEHGLSSLPAVDGRLDAAVVQVRASRIWLDSVRTRDLTAADNLVTKTRRVARAVKMAIDMRRSLWV
jgi:hypothetical protein